jgi:general secretion pathway protein G
MSRGKSRKSAFTLVELMMVIILLGVLAALTVPMLQNFSPGAREGALRGDLHSLRHQILIYQLHHNGDLPPPDQLPDLLMNRTTSNGQIDQQGPFGPYVVRFPSNPYNGRVDVKTIPAGGALAADGSSGWLYGVEGSNFTIVANSPGQDRSGIPLIQY